MSEFAGTRPREDVTKPIDVAISAVEDVFARRCCLGVSTRYRT